MSMRVLGFPPVLLVGVGRTNKNIVPSLPATVSTVTHDEFTGTANATIEGRVPDTATYLGTTAWVRVSGTATDFVLNGAGVLNFNATTFNSKKIDTGLSSCLIEAQVNSAVPRALTFNQTGANDLWFVSISTNQISIASRIASVQTTYAQDSSFVLAANQVVKIHVSGDTINVFVDDVFRVGYTQTNRALKTITHHGVRGGGASSLGLHWNYYKVYSV